jgi:hypothetical protein
MKKFYAFAAVIAVFISNTYFAQVSLSWARGAGSSSDDFSEDIAVDKRGNSYTTGYFYSSLDFGPFTITPVGNTDVFVAKLNSSGNIVWAKAIGGSGSDQTGSICLDNQQFIYVVGSFSGTADFDPGPATYSMTSIGTTDAFVCKLDSEGNFVWAKQFGGSGQTFANDVVTDSLGAVYITGDFTQSGDFNPGAGINTLTSGGSNDMFICKLSSQGNFIWAKSIGETGSDGGSDICHWRDHIFISGWFNNSCDINPGGGTFPVTSIGGYDIFVLDLDTLGNFTWGGSMGGTLTEFCRDITTDDGGNIYITGYFEGTSDFNPGPSTYSLTSAGSEDIFIVKLNSAGTLKWAKAMGGPSQDDGNGIRTDNGYVITTGFFSESGDFDPGSDYSYTLTSSGNADIFFSQLDLNGNFVCAEKMGGVGSDLATAIGIDSTGMIYITGGYSGYTNLPADFDPGPGSFTMTSTNSTYDIFVAKYSGCGTLSDIRKNNNTNSIISVYPNPTSGMLALNVTTDFFTVEIIDSKGQLMKRMNKDKENKIDISDLPAGIYLLKVSTAGANFVTKVVRD